MEGLEKLHGCTYEFSGKPVRELMPLFSLTNCSFNFAEHFRCATPRLCGPTLDKTDEKNSAFSFTQRCQGTRQKKQMKLKVSTEQNGRDRSHREDTSYGQKSKLRQTLLL